MNKLFKNYLYNISIQLFLIIIPIVTTPYISRVIGAELIGLRSYTYSIFTWFSLVSCLGVSTYGLREIAFVNDDREQRSIVFFELFNVKILLSILTILAYIIFLIYERQNIVVYSIYIIDLVANIFDISWFYQGIEEVKTVAIKNFIVKTIFVILLFLLVRDKSDFYIYLVIYSLSLLLGNLSFWFNLKKYINLKFMKFDLKNILKHLKYCFQFFIPMIAYSLYTVLDKTMIGLLTSSNLQNAYYEQSQTIIKLSTTIILAMNTVIAPRMAMLYKNKNIKEIFEKLFKSLQVNMMLSIPISFGLFAISADFVPWFFGNEFYSVIKLLRILCVIPVFTGLSTCITSIYLNIINKQNIDTLCVFISSMINIILNLILIPKFFSTGAVLASVVAEICSAMMHLYCIKNIIHLNKLFLVFSKYVVLGLLMCGFVFQLSLFLESNIISTFIEIFSGAIIYLILLFIVKDRIIFDMFLKLKNKFMRI